MHTPSVESAQAMAQAVLTAHLCHRYHDLASIASEPLKQRLHFLALPDGSNLKDLLLLWDSNLLSSPLSSSSAPPPSQRLVTVEKYIRERWSPDQSPPTPPFLWGCSSWETARVYRRALVSESVQAFVPLGALDSLHILGVLLVEEDHSWKYHNMAFILESDLVAHAAWKLMNECGEDVSPLLLNAMDGVSAPRVLNVVDQDNKEEDDDSDDDYWGQYGDADESPSPSAKGESATSHGTAFVRENLSAYCDTAGEDDEEDDQYWRKYTEHQEERSDIKRQKPRTEAEHDDPAATDLCDRDSATHAEETRRVLACLGDTILPRGIPAIASAGPALGPVDPTTLAALLERLTAHEADDDGMIDPLAGRVTNDSPDCVEEQMADQEPGKINSYVYFEPRHDPSMEEAMPSSVISSLSTSDTSSSLNWSISGGSESRSRSQSQSTSTSTSISSCTTATTATCVHTFPALSTDTSRRGTLSTESLVAQEDQGTLASLSVASLDCTDSFYRGQASIPLPAPQTVPSTPKDVILKSLRSIVMEATSSGLTKDDVFEILDSLYEHSTLMAQCS
ncbi:unnamed protein product [Mortierella alpina]